MRGRSEKFEVTPEAEVQHGNFNCPMPCNISGGICSNFSDSAQGPWGATRTLGVVVVIAIASTLALAIALGVREATRPAELDSCITNGCIKAAARVNAWINRTENPCNDFFNFACGSWIYNRVIPPEKAYLGTFSDLRDEMLIKVKRIVESTKLTADKKTNALITDMRKFYATCLQRNKYGSAADRLKKIFALFPMPHVNQEGWNTKTKNFDAYLAELTYADIHLLMMTFVMNDVQNTSKQIFSIDQPPLKLISRRYYLEANMKNVRDAYIRCIERTLKQVYNDLNIKGVTIDAESLMELETEIANATNPPEERRDINRTDNRWTLGQLKATNKEFNWDAYIKFLFAALPLSKQLTNDTIITVRAPQYLAQLDSILKKTSKKKFGELLTFMLVSSFTSDLTKEYRSIAADFNEVYTGSRGEDTRWRSCVSVIKDFIFQNIVARIYSQEYFDKQSKTEANEMIYYVRNAFYTLLKVNTWMDSETRHIAAAKARKIVPKIGYPEYIYNSTYLEEQYGEIFQKINGSVQYWFNDSTRIRQILNKKRLHKLWEKVDRNKWISHSVVVNAFYSPSYNQIYFPMGILGAPFFDKDYPKYLNYGGIGAVIGHEITHGFDDRGRQRDGDGNFRPWWPQSTVKAFKAAAQCIIDQYGRYRAPIKLQEIYLNGIQTQGESIADNGGVKQAFKGYREWIRKRGFPEKKLPGLPYTPEQLFFINYGQIWCSTMTDQEWVQRILSGVHPPTMFRVIGTMSNTPYFQEAFQCKAGDRMNPAKKCSVW